MHKVKREHIVVENRQRSGDLKSLRDATFRSSIESLGLLHPIVVAVDPSLEGPRWRLVCGGRRLANIDWIAEEGRYFLCDRETILPGEIPVTFLHELSPIEREEAELDENIRRSNLTWQDETRAFARIHELRQSENPKQTITDTAKALNIRTNVPIPTMHKKLTEARIVAKHLDDPAIARARTANDAYALVVRKEEALFRAALVERRQAMPIDITLFHGDCCAILPTLPADSVDLIACDPPYAIDAGSAGFRSRSVHHHNYADTIEAAQKIIRSILTEGFRLTKPRANLFLFCDIDLWTWIGDNASAAGWTVFRTPIIWQKSDSEGLAPWGSQGFRRTYELIFFATKGQRGLISSPIDILRHNRVPKAERDYGPAKPPSLMKELIECSTLPNDLVLDPCCGSGATLVAARESRRRAIGIEADQNAYNLALAKTADVIPAPAASDL